MNLMNLYMYQQDIVRGLIVLVAAWGVARSMRKRKKTMLAEA
jgi:hypothetical protein